MKLRKFFLILPAVVLLLPAGRLSASPTPEVPRTGKDFTIAAVYATEVPGTISYQLGLPSQSFYPAFKRVLTGLAKQQGFGLLEHGLGSNRDLHSASAAQLLAEGVSGVAAIYNQSRPSLLNHFVRRMRRRGIPVVLFGAHRPSGIAGPFVGGDAVLTGRNLGKATAERFRESFPGRRARVVISGSGRLQRERRLEAGFRAGFQEVLPRAQMIPAREASGTVRSAETTILLVLARHPDANVFAGMSDLRTFGILNALRSQGRGTPETELVAGAGGSQQAMLALLDPQNAWKVQAGLAVGDIARQGSEILEQMIAGERPIRRSEQIRVASRIFVSPSAEEVEAYLADQLGIEDFRVAGSR